jgi:hypothetical protein
MINNEKKAGSLNFGIIEPLSIPTLSGKRSKCESTVLEQSIAANSIEVTYSEKHEKYIDKGITLYALRFINKITKENDSNSLFDFSFWIF